MSVPYLSTGHRALTLHLLPGHHISPPSETDRLVKQNRRPRGIRCNDIKVLLRLVGDGGDTGWRDIANYCVGLDVCNIVDRCE